MNFTKAQLAAALVAALGISLSGVKKADISEIEIDQDDEDKCEGCDKPATHCDSEGVPLCEEDYNALVAEQAPESLSE